MLTTVLMLAVGAVLGSAITAAIMLRRQGALEAERARLGAELAAAQQALVAERDRLADMQRQLRETFALLSQDALRENRSDFLQHASALLQPVRETLDRVQRQLTAVDKDREGSYRSVATQLEQLQQAQDALRQSAETLSRSLRSPNVRGQWGEIQLKRIVELAGMLEQCDFLEKEATATSDGGRLTPDLVVRLPGDASIVIDAKVPIDAYMAATTARTEAAREEHLAAHARQVRDHIRALAAKQYWKQFPRSPAFVVMFLPLEPLLPAAFEHDGTLLEFAAAQRVIPATPMTLLAILRAAAYGWQEHALAENAEEIRQIGRDLYERIATMVEHLEHLGGALEHAGDAYNRVIGSLQTKVLPGARKFKELGVTATKTLGEPAPIDLTLRSVRGEEVPENPADSAAPPPEPSAAPVASDAADAPAAPKLRRVN